MGQQIKFDLGQAPEKVREVFERVFVDGGIEHLYASAAESFKDDDIVILADKTDKVIALPRFEFLLGLHRDPDQELADFIRQKVTKSVREKTGVPGFWLIVRGRDETHVVSIKVWFNSDEG